MFCHYRKMRIAACQHAKALPDAPPDSATQARPALIPARPTKRHSGPKPMR
jgi:hypothetical protein